ncbi:MAG TPA: TetR family transcriptional regulator C-terminal domain-containing protein [Acidimicrobiales bacterium]|nr:TetR family transcriptional regulator C-terminal domain-containing protein [Acidimicrobiales bacterium]
MGRVSHRDRLIDGAIDCLQTKGFARTTARDIAAAADANLASIGYHFGSKEALLNEALIRIFRERDAYIGQQVLERSDATALGSMTSSFVAVRSVFDQYRPLLVASIEAMAQAEHSPELREQMADYYRQAREGIAHVIRTGLGPAAEEMGTDPEVLASLMLATFDGLAMQWLLDPSAAPSGEDLVTALIEWVTLAVDDAAPSPRKPAPKRPKAAAKDRP